MSAKISLCLIVGNVEDYIERCLTSFKPIADEICAVRAIGTLAPDKTLDIARDKFGAKVAEYHNAPGHEWPHVDSFAAARQQSFDMATGDYCFWVDSDDVLESGAEVVRELADRGEFGAYFFPYKIFGRGLMVPRERMVSPKSGQWIYPVHECFDFYVKPMQAAEDQRVVVTHMPQLSKTGSGERNLRILQSIPEAEMSAGLLYHLHSELIGNNKVPEAVAVAKKALQHPELGRPEKCEIFMNLAMAADRNLPLKHTYLTQAYASDPTRREALALLATNSLDMGNAADGLAFARQMMATPRPAFEEWNSRCDIYDWIGDDVFQQALRANGMEEKAEQIRRNALAKAGGARIALIHATRGRPEKAAKARKLWLGLAEKPDQVEHIFVYDSDDKISHCLARMYSLEVPAGGGCVRAWNEGVMYTAAPVIVQLSDDWTPLPQWDRIILERIGDVTKPAVLAISDGFRKDDLLCMAICTRTYWVQDYFMFHPWFTGVFSDNWFTDEAYRRGQVIQARDVVFSHDHPFKTNQPADQTYIEQNAPYRYVEGEKVYNELKLRRDWSTVPGWFNYSSFYQQVAALLKDGDTIAEVGVWLGRSIIFIAQELKRAGKKVKIYAVDTFKGEAGQEDHMEVVAAHGGSIRAAFEANLARCGVADMVEIIEGDSAESAAKVADASLAFCFIDAAHDYESARKDIAAWQPKIVAGGVLAGHDAQWEPVKKAVTEAFPYYTMGPVWVRK